MDGQVACMKGFITNEAPNVKLLVIVNPIFAKIIQGLGCGVGLQPMVCFTAIAEFRLVTLNLVFQ